PRLRDDIIGKKFNDFNSNGVLDFGEPGLANFTLYLDVNGNNILDPNEPSAISNISGDFGFNNPPVGTYFLREIPQPGFVKTTEDQLITITEPIRPGQPDIVLNVGNVPVNVTPPQPEIPDIPDNVIPPDQEFPDIDEDDIDDAVDDIEDAIDDIDEDDIDDAVDDIEDAIDDIDEDDIENAIEDTVDAVDDAVDNLQASRTASQVTGTGRIAGTKFNDINGNNAVDPDETGLPGFTIYLDLNDNRVLDTGEPQSITDAEGRYSFENLPADTYPVREVQQAGFTKITPDPIINLAEGQEVDFVNIGNQSDGTVTPIPPVDTEARGTITGVKFDDRNANGEADTDEPRLIGVPIFVDLNNNGFPEANEPFTSTDANGEYRFTLRPGNYRVRETPPAGFVNTTPTPVVPLVPGQTVVYNFGNTSIFDPNTVISGFIFTDENNNGVRDTTGTSEDINNDGILDPTEDLNNNGIIDGITFTEPGIPTAQVFLDIDGDGELDSNEDLNLNGVLDEGEDIDGDGNLDFDEPETFTDPDGRYTFNGVLPGIYTVDVVRQENLFRTSSRPVVTVYIGPDVPPADPNISSDPINLPFGQSLFDIDFGVNVRSPQEDTVSGIVFADNNGNGLFEPLQGEVGLPGVEVFLDVHTDGQIQGFEPNQISGAGGTYGLDVSDVDSGSYPLLQVLRTGFTQTTPTALVSVGDGASTVYNFGNQPQTLITGTVFADFNSNGIQDFSDTNGNNILDPDEFVERGVPGFRIYADINNNGIFDGSQEPNTFTNTEGEYAIVGLLPGTYTIRIVPRDVITDPNDPTATTQGFIPTTQTDITITIDEFDNSELEIDFGQSPVVPPIGRANISGIAFLDNNGDGQVDVGPDIDDVDRPLPNVTIYIDANQNEELDDDERFAVTDQFGRYDIPEIDPGTYIVRQEPRPGFTDSTVPQPVIITLAAGDNADFVNFANNPTNFDGAVEPFADLGGIVFNDINGDGQIDPGENGISDVTVFLDSNNNSMLDNQERETLTDSLGVYDFPEIPPGTYTVRQVPPPGLFQTNPDPTVTLFAGEDANFVNFGNSTNPAPIPPPPIGNGSIAGVTFEDLNGNGFLEAGEPGIGGVVVYFDQNNNSVRDADEVFVASDVNGNYGFSNLADASYTVRQDLSQQQAAIFNQTVPSDDPGRPIFISTFGGDNVPNVNIGNIRI
ncbi:MAG: SdrD B-like domain-containing protein, partial [Trichodesmium sp.]